jgi:hypothetical protein
LQPQLVEARSLFVREFERAIAGALRVPESLVRSPPGAASKK